MFRKNHVMRFFTVMTLVIAMFVGLLVPCCQKAEAAAYTVSFNGRGGYVKSGRPHAYESSFITTPETRPYKAPEYFFQKTGYEQIGWTTRSANTTVVDYTEGQTISLTSNITLYPIYKVKQYTITCYRQKQASYGVIKSFKANYGTSVLSNANLPKAPTGYSRYWCTLGGNTALTSNTLVKSNMSIYPVDTPISKRINVVVNGTSKIYYLKTGQTIQSQIPNPSQSGMVFVGWGTNQYNNTNVYLPTHVCCFTNSVEETWYPKFASASASNGGTFDINVNAGDLNRLLSSYNQLVAVLEDAKTSAEKRGRAIEITQSYLNTLGSILTLAPGTQAAGVVIMAGSLSLYSFKTKTPSVSDLSAAIEWTKGIRDSLKGRIDVGDTSPIRIQFQNGNMRILVRI